jgi:uncharacterized protein
VLCRPRSNAPEGRFYGALFERTTTLSTTHVERDNIELIKNGFKAFSAGDMATLTEMFDAKTTWDSEPTGILKGKYHSRDAIFSMFAQLHRETEGTFSSKPTAMAAAHDKVFVQTEVTAKRHGRSLHTGEVIVFTIADGLIREVQLYSANHTANAAFWA